MSEGFTNQLHYGDNLVRLRGEGVDRAIPDEIADLIYLDPPFNSARNYNLLFKQHKGQESPAQIMTFEDTWTFQPHLLIEFKRDQRNNKLFELINSLYCILGDSDMMAYLLMMAPRLLELHRKLKPTGSLYLHCDPVASHYLKIILDVIFEPENFKNEIVWKRTSAHGDSKQGSKHFGRIHDIIFCYTKDASSAKWNSLFTPYEKEYIDTYYKYIDSQGRRYWRDNLTAAKAGGDTKYEWRIKRKLGAEEWEADLDEEHLSPRPDHEYRGVFPPASRYWAYSRSKMIEMAREGRVVYSATGTPMYKRLLEEMKGRPVQDIWDDIRGLGGLGSNAKERRGYPTQKPLALLERIIAASTDEGDLVLDPFAGCGTALVAAERMGRKWIGIDVTYLAINEVVARLQEEKREGHELRYELLGTPKDEDAAVALFESTKAQSHKPFEQWAVTLVRGEWNDKKGSDRGVDGVIHMWDLQEVYKKGVVQVKGGNSLNLSYVRDFARVIQRDNAVLGIMIAQKEPTSEMKLEAQKMGFAEYPGSKKIPRFQILTTKGILERGEQAILPEAWLIRERGGVGRAIKGQTETLFDNLEG